MHKYLTEFVGTCFLVTTVALAGIHAAPLAPFVVGLALAVLVYMGGHVSGGHYNPAVSLALVVRGRLAFLDFLPYVAAQILGGFAGVGIVLGLIGRVAGPLPGVDVDPLRVMLAEALFTALLCLVVLHTTTAAKTEGNSHYGLAIGLSVAVGALCVGPISGGCFNPAVAVGPNVLRHLAGDEMALELVGFYVVGPLFGALVANGLFALQTGEGLFPADKDESEEEEPAAGRGRLRIADHRRDAA